MLLPIVPGSARGLGLRNKKKERKASFRVSHLEGRAMEQILGMSWRMRSV